MVIEENICHILSKLTHRGVVELPLNGSDIVVRVIDDASKLSLSSVVYDGGNYIPPGVRQCLSPTSPGVAFALPTFLTIDEAGFQVRLNYLGQADSLTQESLQLLLEEFSTIASEWRLYLDDHGKRDLVHVRVK